MEACRNIFTRADLERLRQALSVAQEPRHYRRLTAVLWVAEGHSVCEAARLAHASRRSVQGWCRTFLAQRSRRADALLCEKPRSGRPACPARALGDEEFLAILGVCPLEVGYQSLGWTLELLATELHRRLGGERPSRDTVRRRLHALGWRWKRPRYVFAEPDPKRAQKNALFSKPYARRLATRRPVCW